MSEQAEARITKIVCSPLNFDRLTEGLNPDETSNLFFGGIHFVVDKHMRNSVMTVYYDSGAMRIVKTNQPDFTPNRHDRRVAAARERREKKQ